MCSERDGTHKTTSKEEKAQTTTQARRYTEALLAPTTRPRAGGPGQGIHSTGTASSRWRERGVSSISGPMAREAANSARSSAAAWVQGEEENEAPDSTTSTPERLVGAGRSAPRSSLTRAPVHEPGEDATPLVPAGGEDGGAAASKVFGCFGLAAVHFFDHVD